MVAFFVAETLNLAYIYKNGMKILSTVEQTLITLDLIESNTLDSHCFIDRGRSPIYRRNNLADKPTQRKYNLDSETDRIWTLNLKCI